MSIFSRLPFLKKKKRANVSRISELRSPYTNKFSLPSRFWKKGKRKKILAVPGIQVNKPSRLKTVLWIVGIFAMAGGITYFVGFSHFFDIKSREIAIDSVKVAGNDALNNLLKKQRLKNLVFFDENNLAMEIKRLHPEVKKVVVKKIFPQKIRVELEKYPVVANIIHVIQGVQKKFTVDSQGFLADENTENPDLPYIKIFSGEPLTVHTDAIDKAKLNLILKTISAFQQKFGIKILNTEYHVREREIHLQTEKNFIVLIDMEKDIDRQFEKLKIALSKINIYTAPIEYIDLRISGTDNEKVIYKMRQG